FQYNKRDLRNILPVQELTEALNTRGAPYFEAAALHGIGVFETLKTISRLAVSSVRKKIADDTRLKAAAPVSGPHAGSRPVSSTASLLKDASVLKIHLGLDVDGNEESVPEAVIVKLSGNQRLERLTLRLDLEIKGKE